MENKVFIKSNKESKSFYQNQVVSNLLGMQHETIILECRGKTRVVRKLFINLKTKENFLVLCAGILTYFTSLYIAESVCLHNVFLAEQIRGQIYF